MFSHFRRWRFRHFEERKLRASQELFDKPVITAVQLYLGKFNPATRATIADFLLRVFPDRYQDPETCRNAVNGLVLSATRQGWVREDGEYVYLVREQGLEIPDDSWYGIGLGLVLVGLVLQFRFTGPSFLLWLLALGWLVLAGKVFYDSFRVLRVKAR